MHIPKAILLHISSCHSVLTQLEWNSHMAEPTHLNSGSGHGRGGRSVRTDGTTAIPEEKSATQRGSFVSGIFNIGARARERERRPATERGRENINFYAKRRV